MRKLLLLSIALCFGLYTIGQQRAVVSKELRNKAVVKTTPTKGLVEQNEIVPQQSPSMVKSESDIGGTWYDLQTRVSMPQRIFLHDDGKIGGIWTYGPEGASSGTNRGTGYNYFDGSEWGPYPEGSIESTYAPGEYTQAGYPSYGPYGENGEIYTCHDYYDGTILGTRDTVGTGEWNLELQMGPEDVEDISFPRVVTTGENNDIIHILSSTWQDYNGQSTALLYAQTIDAGLTWEYENQLFDDLGPDFSLGVLGESYDWAEPRDGNLVFAVGDNWMDFVLMKSEDDGESWDLTTVWECPFPLWQTGEPVDTFYCPDGSKDLAIDSDGKVHVVFGLTRAGLNSSGAQVYYPGVDGIIYWNEDMEPFSDDIHALNPDTEHPNSELVENVNLIGWSQDVNGDGILDILDELAAYNTGLSGHPQMVLDDMNQIFVVYASVTEGYDDGISTFRHIWARASMDEGNSWGDFTDLTGDITYSFFECAFPSASSSSDDNVHIVFQVDEAAGTETDSQYENFIRYMNVPKQDLLIGVKEEKIINENNVSQNFPNPFNGTSSVFVTLDKAATLELTVTNMVGQNVYRVPTTKYNKGKQEFIIDASGFPTGVYFYTVNSGDKSVTKKMIVE